MTNLQEHRASNKRAEKYTNHTVARDSQKKGSRDVLDLGVKGTSKGREHLEWELVDQCGD